MDRPLERIELARVWCDTATCAERGGAFPIGYMSVATALMFVMCEKIAVKLAPMSRHAKAESHLATSSPPHPPVQDCVLSAGPDEVLPDPNDLLVWFDKDALFAFRLERMRQIQQQAEAAASKGAAAAAAAPAVAAAVQHSATPGRSSVSSPSSMVKQINANITGGLMLCSREWIGLELQHAGSWQLSLVYTDEQLRMFSRVRRSASPGQHAASRWHPVLLALVVPSGVCMCCHVPTPTKNRKPFRL